MATETRGSDNKSLKIKDVFAEVIKYIDFILSRVQADVSKLYSRPSPSRSKAATGHGCWETKSIT